MPQKQGPIQVCSKPRERQPVIHKQLLWLPHWHSKNNSASTSRLPFFPPIETPFLSIHLWYSKLPKKIQFSMTPRWELKWEQSCQVKYWMFMQYLRHNCTEKQKHIVYVKFKLNRAACFVLLFWPSLATIGETSSHAALFHFSHWRISTTTKWCSLRSSHTDMGLCLLWPIQFFSKYI